MIEIEIPYATPSLNRWQRMHFHERRRVKKEMVMIVGLALHGRVGWRTAARKREVKITRYSARTLDVDNLVGGCKPLVDALVTAGVLVDDSPEWVTVTYAQGKERRVFGRTLVEVR